MKYATTDKLNDSMKAKVFKYRSDGNTVVAPYMELEPYAENVYLSLSRKNEYGNEDDDCFHVVCRIENVYFSSGQYSRRFLNGENRRDETAALLQELDRGYASGRGKRSLCQVDRKHSINSPFHSKNVILLL